MGVVDFNAQKYDSIIAMAEEKKGAPIVPTRLEDITKAWLGERLRDIEKHAAKDVLTLVGSLDESVLWRTRIALEHLENRKPDLLVLLDTPGGIVEVAERIVNTLRCLYDKVHFLVPVRAMSAGTVLVMSGDTIYMDYFSCLGPIDPQIINRDGRLVPALSYLRQYQRLRKQAEEGRLTMADMALLNKLDLAELHQIELAASLSQSLIREWLSQYKFKDWAVTDDKKKARAKGIAAKLGDHEMWYTHSRGIHKDVLERELKLTIDDYSQDAILKPLIWGYFSALTEFFVQRGVASFVHSRKYL